MKRKSIRLMGLFCDGWSDEWQRELFHVDAIIEESSEVEPLDESFFVLSWQKGFVYGRSVKGWVDVGHPYIIKDLEFLAGQQLEGESSFTQKMFEGHSRNKNVLGLLEIAQRAGDGARELSFWRHQVRLFGNL